jgi:hypothetical protein
MSDTQFPENKDELLDYIAEGYDEMNAFIGSLSPDEFTRLGEEGWSIKDHLAHLAAWEAGIVALLNHEPRWDAMGLSEDILEQNYASINDLIYERVTRLSADEVKAWFADAHTAMLNTLNRLTWEDLNRPYSDYGRHASLGADPVGAFVVGNTYGHYAEHIEWMRAILAAQRS